MATEHHKELASIIKKCHSSLRELYKLHGAEKAWTKHVQDKMNLRKYADAMYQLSQIWEMNSDNAASPAYSRIKWAMNFCHDYYDNGICLEKRARELRLLLAWCADLSINECALRDSMPSIKKVLDVGSCYNPFAQEPRFSVTAIDLYPATTSVLQGDFLKITVADLDDRNAAALVENGKVTQLQRGYFDCVIFSLLLEYLPSSDQRLACCRKAYETLCPEGILVIITPDSKHNGKNAALMKHWRYTLATLGYMRVRFENLPYITCLAFRKASHPRITQHWADQQQLYFPHVKIPIPQDK